MKPAVRPRRTTERDRFDPSLHNFGPSTFVDCLLKVCSVSLRIFFQNTRTLCLHKVYKVHRDQTFRNYVFSMFTQSLPKFTKSATNLLEVYFRTGLFPERKKTALKFAKKVQTLSKPKNL